MGARDRIRQFFEENVGKVVTTEQISKIAGIHDYQRRIRELRNDEGMQIQSYNDNFSLRPNEYMLVTLNRLPRVSHKIDKALRYKILERNGYMCQICGAMSGDIDPFDESRTIRLQVDHIDPDGPPTESNLRTLCNNCNEGRSNLSIPPEDIRAAQRGINKLGRKQQREIYDWLKKRIEPTNNEDD